MGVYRARRESALVWMAAEAIIRQITASVIAESARSPAASACSCAVMALWLVTALKCSAESILTNISSVLCSSYCIRWCITLRLTARFPVLITVSIFCYRHQLYCFHSTIIVSTIVCYLYRTTKVQIIVTTFGFR